MKISTFGSTRAGIAAATVALGLIAAASAAAQDYMPTTRPNVEYAVHDGVKLTGDLYAPKGLDKAPVIVAVHGGGWQGGNPDGFKDWGAFLARHGYALFAIRYRLAKPGIKTYPAAVYDVKAAVQFVRARAADLGVDPARIALLGASAGAHLAALVGIAGGEPQFSSQYRDDANAAVPADVKAVLSFYGIYDMQAQWEHDQTQPARRSDHGEIHRRAADEGSPHLFRRIAGRLRHVDRNRTRYLLLHGTRTILSIQIRRKFSQPAQAGGIFRQHRFGAGRRPRLDERTR